MHTLHTKLTLVTACMLAACTPDDGSNGFYDTGTGDSAGNTSAAGDTDDGGTDSGDDGNTSGSGGSGSSGDAGSGSGDDSGGIAFDVGDGMDSAGDDGGSDLGCRGVDFLFIVDNSGSMAEEQLALVSSFAGFSAEIEATLDDKAKDFNVMVIDTDDGSSKFPAAEAGTCDAELGAGLTTNPSHFACGVPDGRRFMSSADPNVPSAFGCLAYVGTGGSGTERPMEAMSRALNDLAGPGQCNADFLREDAILVVTFITDEEETGSMGDPTQWRDALLQAKGGDPHAIVVLGLFGDDDLPNPVCNGGADLAPRLVEFMDYFGDHGLRGSVCAEDYAPFFTEATAVIEQSCDGFQPPG